MKENDSTVASKYRPLTTSEARMAGTWAVSVLDKEMTEAGLNAFEKSKEALTVILRLIDDDAPDNRLESLLQFYKDNVAQMTLEQLRQCYNELREFIHIVDDGDFNETVTTSEQLN